MKHVAFILAAAFSLFASISASGAPKEAEWTIMVYLNAKNNLERFGLSNFAEMAQVGGSDSVNLVVQMGRPTPNQAPGPNLWSGVKRYLVKKGTQPTPKDALMDLGKDPADTDMGRPETLDSFIRWAAKTYPSKKKMLVIWNHGQGWRYQMAVDPNDRVLAARPPTFSMNVLPSPVPVGDAGPPIGGYRSVSSDSDTGNILYNREIQDVLEKARGEGLTFDVVAFDACLMNMVETAYALRSVSAYLVGSQDLEPGAGWAYAPWLQSLNAAPSTTPRDLSRLIVKAYASKYGRYSAHTTQSAIELGGVSRAASAISAFADAVAAKLPAEKRAIAKVRNESRAFADWYSPPLYTSIDIVSFLERYAAETQDADLKALAQQAITELNALVIENYASDDSKGHDPRGLAIYFPASKQHFFDDQDHKGYFPTNTMYPVEFVEKERWSHFLLKFLDVTP